MWDPARDHRLSAVPQRAPPASVYRQRVNDDGDEERSRLGFSVLYFDSIQRLKSHQKGSKGPMLCLDWYPISWGPDVATSTGARVYCLFSEQGSEKPVVKEWVRWSSPFGLCTRLLWEEVLSVSAGSRALSSLSGFLEAASRRSPPQLGNWPIVLLLEVVGWRITSVGCGGKSVAEVPWIVFWE